MDSYNSFNINFDNLKYEYAAEIIKNRLEKRNIRFDSLSEYSINLFHDSTLTSGEFRINENNIYSNGISGILHGAGYYMRKCIYKNNAIKPCDLNITIKPDCSVRGAYFASHFHNYYHVVPIEEFIYYLEDLALSGINAIMAIVPMINLKSIDDPCKEESIFRLSQLFCTANKLEMKTCTILDTNSGYIDYPDEYKFTPVRDDYGRHGNTGNMMCISKPGAMELIDYYNADILQCFLKYNAPIDMFMTWPYDEGGCGCEKCAPWGAKGFIYSSKHVFSEAKKYYPEAKCIVSTWTFDTPFEGEWESLSKSLEDEKWCDIILADAHENYPRYPLDCGVPGNLPLITFPEISMWGLYPWGGFGANPLPQRFSNLWKEHAKKTDGGFYYSEGIYEDINKFIISGFYFNGNANYSDILSDYANYEFGLIDTKLFVELCELIEKCHTNICQSKPVDMNDAEKAYMKAVKIDSMIQEWARKSWKWRIIYLRAKIEYYRCYRNNNSGDMYNYLREIPEVMSAFRELAVLFRCSEIESTDPYQQRIRPWC